MTCFAERFWTAILWAGVLASPMSAGEAPAASPLQPNFIVFLCDNLGYGDIGCFGSPVHRTPHVDRLAAEGMRLTSFYAASGVCTPSRAALMTGCYPRRVGLHLTQPDGAVLRPVSPNGLNPDELTIAEVLKAAGYATACIGKWHLGDQAEFLPTRQGFDEFFGIPYSDDMVENRERGWPPLPLMRDHAVIRSPVDRNLLTQRYTEEAIKFITANRQRPFFLYLPQAMPGSTARPFASPRFQGRSANGPYGDSVEELDWSTGEILDTLRDLQLNHRTLIVWTSDNGAPQRRPAQGSNRPLRGWGYTTWEGGMRVPCIIRWPGQIPAGCKVRRNRLDHGSLAHVRAAGRCAVAAGPNHRRARRVAAVERPAGREVAARGVLLLLHGPAASRSLGPLETASAAGCQTNRPCGRHRPGRSRTV